jgi:two-component system chemotaxis sensor kinase CheA
VRVDVQALDALAEMAEELARARESLTRVAAMTRVDGAQAPLAALDKTAGDLIALADRLRRRPASEAWRPLRRITRDAAAALGKDVEIAFSGDHIAIDAHIIEGLRAPLAHIVRNAVAHGIESPAERLASGKPRTGRIEVSIRIEPDGEIVLDIADDGAGLDPARIRRRGIENGMMSAANAARMTDDEIIALLFAPGFSTAARLSAYAGRGVGLNAAKAAVEAFGGKLEAERPARHGALFRIRIAHAVQPPPIVLVDLNEPAHNRIASHLSAAGYDLEHHAAEPAPARETPKPAASLKEQSA